MLHRVCSSYTPDNFLRNYEISQEGLEKKIIEYRQKGYEFVSMEEAYARMSARRYVSAYSVKTSPSIP